jgi:hypothetical protein
MFALITLNKIASVRPDAYDAEEGAPERTEETAVNVFKVRVFYRRKGGKPGSRITFDDGGGFAVAEPFEYLLENMPRVAKGKTVEPYALPVTPAAPIFEGEPIQQ